MDYWRLMVQKENAFIMTRVVIKRRSKYKWETIENLVKVNVNAFLA